VTNKNTNVVAMKYPFTVILISSSNRVFSCRRLESDGGGAGLARSDVRSAFVSFGNGRVGAELILVVLSVALPVLVMVVNIVLE